MPISHPIRRSAAGNRRFLILGTLRLMVSGCSWMPFVGSKDKDGEDEEVNATEQMLYRNAQRSLRAGNYERAITALERLEARFPFGRYAEQAQLELVYARYQSSDHDTARLAADRFIRLNPQHSDIDYAYYLKGLAAYNKKRGLLDRVSASDISKRDMSSAQEAYADFAELLRSHPNSDYASDAKQRMIYLRNMLAASEVHVADYYMRRGAYVAAANRARFVIENYPTADEPIPEALIVLVEANYKLGLTDAANDALRVLSINYPNHPSFDANGDLVLAERIRNRDRSWMNMMTFGVLDRPEVPPPIKFEHPEGFTPPATPAGREADAEEDEQNGKKKRRGWFSWLPLV